MDIADRKLPQSPAPEGWVAGSDSTTAPGGSSHSRVGAQGLSKGSPPVSHPGEHLSLKDAGTGWTHLRARGGEAAGSHLPAPQLSTQATIHFARRSCHFLLDVLFPKPCGSFPCVLLALHQPPANGQALEMDFSFCNPVPSFLLALAPLIARGLSASSKAHEPLP